MKKLVFVLAMAAFGQNAFSQTANTATSAAQSPYEKVMAEKIAKLNVSRNADELTALQNDFARIAAKETTRWEPNYYAALAILQRGRLQMKNPEKLDAVADEAQKYLSASEALSADNPENLILEKMLHSLRMLVNPMARFMTEGPLASDALAKAEKLDPENPRITLLKAEDSYFTPEQFGGSKAKGIELFKQAIGQYKAYKTAGKLAPNWGREEAEYFVSQAK